MKRSDLGVLTVALRAAGSARSRLLVALLLLLVGALLFGLLVAFSPAHHPDPRVSLAALLENGSVPLFVLAAAVVLWPLFATVGGVVTRDAAFTVIGREHKGRHLPFVLSRSRSLYGLPLSLAGAAIVPALLLLLVLQVLRLGTFGAGLLLLLLPVVLFFASGATRIVARFVVAGHLAAAAVVLDRMSAFNSLSRAAAWLRRDAWRITLYRLGGLLAVLAMSVPRVLLTLLGLGLAAVLVRESVPEALLPFRRVLTLDFAGGGSGLVLAGAILAALLVWLLSIPVSLVFGARAALYLIHRRHIDHVPLDVVAGGEEDRPEPREDKTPEELGIELVHRLVPVSEEK